MIARVDGMAKRRTTRGRERNASHLLAGLFSRALALLSLVVFIFGDQGADTWVGKKSKLISFRSCKPTRLPTPLVSEDFMVCEAPGILPFLLTNQIRERDQMRGAWDSGSVPIFVRSTFILLRGAAVSLTFGIFVTCNRGRRCAVLYTTRSV